MSSFLYAVAFFVGPLAVYAVVTQLGIIWLELTRPLWEPLWRRTPWYKRTRARQAKESAELVRAHREFVESTGPACMAEVLEVLGE